MGAARFAQGFVQVGQGFAVEPFEFGTGVGFAGVFAVGGTEIEPTDGGGAVFARQFGKGGYAVGVFGVRGQVAVGFAVDDFFVVRQLLFGEFAVLGGFEHQFVAGADLVFGRAVVHRRPKFFVADGAGDFALRRGK